MLRLTALICTHNDELRLGRALESLRPCDELLIFDQDSRDHTSAIAREYGARVRPARGASVSQARTDWILCLLPMEALSEGLEASLFEWKLQAHDAGCAFAMMVREQAGNDWISYPATTRLFHRRGRPWGGPLPPNDAHARILEGDLLRFREP